MKHLVAAVAIAIWAAGLAGQVGNLEFCTVVGRVTDERGRVIPGILVEIRTATTSAREDPQNPFTNSQPQPDEGFQMSDPRRIKDVFAWAESDAEGWFRMAGVKKPGAYMLVVRSQKGFRETQAPLAIAASVGDEFRADLVLRPLPSRNASPRGDYAHAIEAARVSERVGELGAAVAHLEVASRLEPDSPVPHYHLARLYLLQGNVARARREAGLAVSRKADCATCWVIRSKVERAAGDAKAARTAAEKAMTLAPESPEAHGAMGLALYDAGEFEAALGELDAAASVGDEDPNVHLILANTLVRLRQPKAALQAYQRFLERFPEAPNRLEVERVMAGLRAP